MNDEEQRQRLGVTMDKPLIFDGLGERELRQLYTYLLMQWGQALLEVDAKTRAADTAKARWDEVSAELKRRCG
jgi:hypothetical protein